MEDVEFQIWEDDYESGNEDGEDEEERLIKDKEEEDEDSEIELSELSIEN